MKRATICIVFFLLLGAIINVAVAWACVAFVPVVMQPAQVTVRKVSRTYHQTRFVQEVFGRVRVTWIDDSAGSQASSWEFTGWPMPSLFSSTSGSTATVYWPKGREIVAAVDVNQVDHGFIISGERIGPSKDYPETWRALPIKPIWLGLGINTIFYASIAWGLCFAAVTLRRVMRRKPGFCTACGYDLRHADHLVCPACGETP